MHSRRLPGPNLNRLTPFLTGSSSRSQSGRRRSTEGRWATHQHIDWASLEAAPRACLFFAPLSMSVFRPEVPPLVYDCNSQLMCSAPDRRLPSPEWTDTYPRPLAPDRSVSSSPTRTPWTFLNPLAPLVKWYSRSPYIVLVFLWLAATSSSFFAWFAILFTGRDPRGPVSTSCGVVDPLWAPSCGLRVHPPSTAISAGSPHPLAERREARTILRVKSKRPHLYRSMRIGPNRRGGTFQGLGPSHSLVVATYAAYRCRSVFAVVDIFFVTPAS